MVALLEKLDNVDVQEREERQDEQNLEHFGFSCQEDLTRPRQTLRIFGYRSVLSIQCIDHSRRLAL